MSRIRSHRFTGALVALGVATLVALLAFAPGSWGTVYGQTVPTTSDPPVVETIDSDTGGTVNAGSVEVAFPPGAVPVDVEVTVTEPSIVTDDDLADLGLPDPPATPLGTTVITAVFSLEAVGPDGTPFDQNNPFDEPVTLTLDVPPETLAAAGGDLDNVVLAFFNTATGNWQTVGCSASGTQLSCEVDHFSIWALFAVEDAGSGAGSGGGTTPQPPATGTGLGDNSAETSLPWIALAGGVLAVVILGGLAVRRTVRQS